MYKGAIAGFSFGGMQAINIRLCECCDLIGYYALNPLPSLTDKVVWGENLMMQVVPGGHSMNVAYLGLYNFLQLIFQ